MANEYSVAIHDYLSAKIAVAETHKQTAGKQDDLASQNYWDGQLEVLNDIRRYMAAKIDLKTQKYY
jgi:hypothetical protein